MGDVGRFAAALVALMALLGGCQTTQPPAKAPPPLVDVAAEPAGRPALSARERLRLALSLLQTGDVDQETK